MTAGINGATTRALAVVAAAHVSAFIYFLIHLSLYGYLPLPFHHNASETFTDFFHTNYWAHNDGRYTEWESIYPIFTFLFASITSPEACYYLDTYFARDSCDNVSIYLMLAVATVAAYQNARLLTTQAIPKLLCFIAICTSFPFLFGFDRGNYVLYAYAFLVFAVSSRSKSIEGFFIACAIGLKPYLLALLAHPSLNLDYRVLRSVLVTTIVTTAVAVTYLSEPNYMAFLEHVAQFDDPYFVGTIGRLLYSVTPDAFIAFSKSADGEFFLGWLEDTYPVFEVEVLLLLAQVAEWVVITAIAIIGIRLIQLRTELSKEFVCYAVLVCTIARFEAVGPYTLILLLPYLPAVYSMLSRAELIALFLLFQPFDAELIPIAKHMTQAYLSGDLVSTDFSLMYGSVFRPVAVLFLLVSVALRLVGWQSVPARALAGT
jgi:hypothetical protein